jgi:hypothetical protein
VFYGAIRHQSCNASYASKSDCVLLEINFNTFLGYYIFFVARISYVLGTSELFTLKMDSDVRDSDLRDGFIDAN